MLPVAYYWFEAGSLTLNGQQIGGYNNIYLLQLGCHPVAVVILHVHKT